LPYRMASASPPGANLGRPPMTKAKSSAEIKKAPKHIGTLHYGTPPYRNGGDAAYCGDRQVSHFLWEWAGVHYMGRLI